MELNLIIKALKDNFFKITVIQIIVSILIVFITLQLPNKYTSYATFLISENSDQNLGSILGNLPFIGSQSSAIREIEISKARLNSVNFFNQIIFQNDEYVQKICASKSYDRVTNTFNYQKKLIDSNGKWKKKISLLDCHETFLSNFSTSVDRNSGLLTITYTSFSPAFAKDLVEVIASNFDRLSRDIELNKISDTNEFLSNELSKTSNADSRYLISKAIQQNLEKLAILSSTKEYILEYVDGPYEPIKKSAPSRGTICIIVFLISLLISSSYFILLSKKSTAANDQRQ